MKLKEFIEQFVCSNTMIRLWTPLKGGNVLLWNRHCETCMEHEILNNKCYQSKYLNHKVIGVTDIVCDIDREAVNIVIQIPHQD